MKGFGVHFLDCYLKEEEIPYSTNDAVPSPNNRYLIECEHNYSGKKISKNSSEKEVTEENATIRISNKNNLNGDITSDFNKNNTKSILKNNLKRNQNNNLENGKKPNGTISKNVAEKTKFTKIRKGIDKIFNLYCMKCDETIYNPPSKAQRNCTKCQSDYLFQCIRCRNHYNSLSTATTHMYYERYNTRAQCSHCGRRYTNKYTLERHMQQMHGGDNYHCQTCNIHFKTRESLSFHRRIVCGKPDKPYKCQHCNFSSKYSGNLSKHALTSHGPESNNTDKFVCDKCKKGFKFLAAFKRHVEFYCGKQKIQKLFKCELCDYKTKWRFMVRQHLKKVHFPMEKETSDKTE